MGDFSREYLELLAEKYPNEAAVCSEIINLSAILTLPKGTEHFISDLHGEYGAVRHILNNCSGVILEKVRRLFEAEQGEAKCRALCSVIYYPRAELACLRERGELDNARLREILEQLCLLAETLSGKYTRGYVRRQMPADWEFVLDELLHIQRDEDANQHRHHSDFQQDGRPGFRLCGIAPRGTVPKKAEKLLYKQGGVIPQQGDGQTAQHTEQPPCKAYPLKLQIMCGVFLPEEQVCREGQRRGQGHQHGGKPLISHGVGEDIHSQHRQQEHQGNLPHKGKPRLR